jgi:uncharacterized Rossmann fold enzyme
MHEFDHLNGVVFRDKVSRLKWDRATTKKTKIQKQRKKMQEAMTYLNSMAQKEKAQAEVALDLNTGD